MRVNHYLGIFTVLLCVSSILALKKIKEIKQSCSVLTDQGTVDLSDVAVTNGQSAA